MTDDNGDPDVDLEAETADAALRNLLSDIPADAGVDPDRAAMIEVAIATAWPDGVPPTVDELAHDPDFDAIMTLAAVNDTDDFDAADDFDVPAGDPDDGADDAADDFGDDSDWDSSDGTDELG